ncbi:unnamed protein product [Bursaphelenchus okinawaensis]|uniref:Uncharacterized protein n=1 Tax=Bursaphelenchus okinawaensis TaxID=465554 RepID=A0A811L1T6_9BILA|nr:unnamed protein product [Bursaphelenchus okinawaensis]CAG9117178.1 unnamed protein product [Bursaphelenchus okinawaensis]
MRYQASVLAWLCLAFGLVAAGFGPRASFGDMGEAVVLDGLSGYGDTGREGRMFVMQDTRADPRCVFCRGGSFRKRFGV